MTKKQNEEFNQFADTGRDTPLSGNQREKVYAAVEAIWSKSGGAEMLNTLNEYYRDQNIDDDTKKWIGYIAVEGDLDLFEHAMA